jgi:hypothetical protein
MPSRKKKQSHVVCPFCGATIPASAKACPACGSDERTGWSEDTYLDGIDLPTDDTYEELVQKEFGGPAQKKSRGVKGWVYLAAIGVLLLMLLGVLRALA